MKTFLWTSLFWIILAIAWLLCLGFGNLWTQVLDNGWMTKFLPKNIQVATCDPVVASALEGIDWCAAAEANDCYPAVEESEIETEDNTQVQEALENIITNQQIIYSYIQDWFTRTNQAISDIQISGPRVVEQWVIDENEQKKLEIQSQMEALEAQYSALQTEMANL